MMKTFRMLLLLIVSITSSNLYCTEVNFDFNGSFQGFTNSGNWKIGTTSTPSSNTGPSSGGHDGVSGFIYLETSSGSDYYSGNTSTLTRMSQDLYGEAISFYYHMYGANIGTLILEVMNDDGGDWEEVWRISGQQQSAQSDAWKYQKIELNGAYGKPSIRFKSIAAGGWQGDIAIDQVTIHTESSSYVISYQYDALGRLVEVADSDNEPVSYVYDAAGNRINISAGTEILPPEIPTNLLVTYTDCYIGDLTWDYPNHEGVQFEVLIGDQYFNNSQLTTTSSSILRDITAIYYPNTYYKVRSKNQLGETSFWSTTAVFEDQCM